MSRPLGLGADERRFKVQKTLTSFFQRSSSQPSSSSEPVDGVPVMPSAAMEAMEIIRVTSATSAADNTLIEVHYEGLRVKAEPAAVPPTAPAAPAVPDPEAVEAPSAEEERRDSEEGDDVVERAVSPSLLLDQEDEARDAEQEDRLLTFRLRKLDEELLDDPKCRQTVIFLPGFEQLKADAEAAGMLVCTAGSCRKVKPLDCFTPSHPTWCRDCMSRPGQKATAALKAKLRAHQAKRRDARAKPHDSTAVEDEAVEWMVSQLVAIHGFERANASNLDGQVVFVMFEFRRADVILRLASWPPDQWIRLQIKSDGAFVPNGELKPNEKATFGHCRGEDGKGYPEMFLVCIRTRGEEKQRTVWLVDVESDDTIQSDTLHVYASGLLASESLGIAASSLSDLVGRVAAAPPSWRRSYESCFLDVYSETQRKEVALMLGFRQINGARVEFPQGNQGKIDAHIYLPWFGPDTALVSTQYKSYNPRTGKANCKTQRNGVVHQPYHADDGIERLVEGFIVKSGDDDYFLVYATQPLSELVKPRKVSKDHDEVRAIFSSHEANGMTTIYPPLGAHAPWVTGNECKRGTQGMTKWLVDEYGFRAAVQLTPGQAMLSRELLDEVAWIAVRPELCP